MQHPVGLEHADPVMLMRDGGETRRRLLRDVLAELQKEAARVFASSGETVDRFLRERRNEAQRVSSLSG